MNFGPINGTLTPDTVEEVTLDGTPIRIEVANLGFSVAEGEGGGGGGGAGSTDPLAPLFFVFADTEDEETLGDPTVEGEGCEAVAPGQRLVLPVRRTPESTLRQVVVKLISADAVGFSVAVR